LHGYTSGENTITLHRRHPTVNVPAIELYVLAPPDAGVITNTAGITATVINAHTQQHRLGDHHRHTLC
jgi:hypothetical protein